MIKKLVVLTIVSVFFVVGVHADGCLPGDPCYIKAKKPVAPVEVAPVAAGVTPQTFYLTAGAGWNFLEKDESILGHQVFDIRAGAYHFAPNWSAELGVGFMPDIRRRQHGSGYTLADDTDGIRLLGDLLYHFDSDGENADVDPYLAFGAGVNLFDDDIKPDEDSTWFVGTGIGAFVNLTETIFLKPDYRLMVVDNESEVNHNVMLHLGWKFCLS